MPQNRSLVDNAISFTGVLDVLDNGAFVRTSGYLPGADDIYVPSATVKRYGLRRGDLVTGTVKTAGEAPGPRSRKDRHPPLDTVDTVNGVLPDRARHRPQFYDLTPLFPYERLWLETGPHVLATRVIDLVMPVGKGQRALIVAPPKAGKTMLLQAVANAIAQNHPECHLMAVLVDERPEEVTEMERSIKGEVVASPFDRPPADHIALAELAIERAKRMVEQGQDVVVVLDSITRLARAYNLVARVSGRILTGGVDSSALHPPKRFLGAARSIEDGGSLTIIATALVETGSGGDNLLFEEFKGTSNAELRLDRRIADRRVFPAIDVESSGTRKEELLFTAEELTVVRRLRRALSARDPQSAIDQLLEHLRGTRSNTELLMRVARANTTS